MVSEPAPETVLERVNLAWAKEQVITGLTIQTAVAGVPVRACAGEVGRVDQRGAGIGSQQDRSLLGRQPPGDGDRLAGAARDLDQDTLDRRRRLLGQNHPDTLASASELAIDLRNLGQERAARDLDQDTLDRRRRVLGEDHPDTLATANKLAADLRAQCDVDDEP
jgi:hypothetical protein